jgi:putative SOS response-associated peptidase YedK
MCGRFSQEAELSEIKLELKVERLELFREFRPLYNIAPSYGPGVEQAFVIQTRDAKRALRLGRWWMIPSFWSKPLKALPAAFNARAEELEQKPFWRQAFRAQRCLVPATGWREFKPEGKKKQPYQFRLERHVFAFAGLWSRWASPDGELIDSFAVVTTPPSTEAARYHDRMPLVMPPDLYERWLDPQADPAQVLQEARERSQTLELEVYPTDPRGNDVRFEGPEVIARFDPSAPPGERTPADPAPAQQRLFPDAPSTPVRPRARRR